MEIIEQIGKRIATLNATFAEFEKAVAAGDADGAEGLKRDLSAYAEDICGLIESMDD